MSDTDKSLRIGVDIATTKSGPDAAAELARIKAGAGEAGAATNKLGEEMHQSGKHVELFTTHGRAFHKLLHQMNEISPALGMALRAAFHPQAIGVFAMVAVLGQILKLHEEHKKKLEELAQAQARMTTAVWDAQVEAIGKVMEAEEKFKKATAEASDDQLKQLEAQQAKEKAVLDAKLDGQKKLRQAMMETELAGVHDEDPDKAKLKEAQIRARYGVAEQVAGLADDATKVAQLEAFKAADEAALGKASSRAQSSTSSYEQFVRSPDRDVQAMDRANIGSLSKNIEHTTEEIVKALGLKLEHGREAKSLSPAELQAAIQAKLADPSTSFHQAQGIRDVTTKQMAEVLEEVELRKKLTEKVKEQELKEAALKEAMDKANASVTTLTATIAKLGDEVDRAKAVAAQRAADEPRLRAAAVDQEINKSGTVNNFDEEYRIAGKAKRGGLKSLTNDERDLLDKQNQGLGGKAGDIGQAVDTFTRLHGMTADKQMAAIQRLVAYLEKQPNGLKLAQDLADTERRISALEKRKG